MLCLESQDESRKGFSRTGLKVEHPDVPLFVLFSFWSLHRGLKIAAGDCVGFYSAVKFFFKAVTACCELLLSIIFNHLHLCCLFFLVDSRTKTCLSDQNQSDRHSYITSSVSRSRQAFASITPSSLIDEVLLN